MSKLMVLGLEIFVGVGVLVDFVIEKLILVSLKVLLFIWLLIFLNMVL